MDSRKQIDPNAAADPESGLFGLECTAEEAAIQIIPVPWEATTSYGGGTSLGPAAILRASHQLDLYDIELEKAYEAGILLQNPNPEIAQLNSQALKIRASQNTEQQIATVNSQSEQVNKLVYRETMNILNSGKIAGILGGEHSTPLGALHAIAETEEDFGILQIDAHKDLRRAYQGFKHSHASIMYNALETLPTLSKLVQVGIRDFCEEELEYLQSQESKISCFYNAQLFEWQARGASWHSLCEEIVESLPQRVWISFDIDGLEPACCPNTGTPVPGGLSFDQANYLLRCLAESEREIIGFDLCEVSPCPNAENELDANIGMRILYKLCAWTLKSHTPQEEQASNPNS